MYSVTPLPDPNTTHAGFIVIAFIVTVAALIAVSVCLGEIDDRYARTKTLRRIAFVWVLVLAFPFYRSFIHKLPTPKNEQVIATKVGQDNRMTTGKYVKPDGHIHYATPDGVVAFPMGSGIPWPDSIIVYKN